MIAACPKCEARYRIEREKLGSEGVRLRCSKCQAVFRVRAPVPVQPPGSVAPIEASGSEPSVRRVEAPPSPAAGAADSGSTAPAMVSADSRGTARPMAPRVDAAAPTATPGPASTGAPGPDAPLVLVGTPDEDVGKKLREALESWGLRAAIVADGVDTMLEIQRQLPAAVVLAPTLPRMYGFQVCEIIKRNESLQRIGVILLGAIHHPDRYRRPPGELYGADAYVEEPDLPEALFSELRQLGVMARPAEARPGGDVTAPRPESPGAPAGVPAPLAPGPAQPDPGRAPEPTLADEPRAPSEMAASASSEPSDELSDARAQAERLARIIVSDIVLYNEDKFAAAIEAGTVAESLGPDLEEGRGLFRDRVDARVQHEKDFLTEELLRVARTRAMQ